MKHHLQCLSPSGYTGIDPETGEVIKANLHQLVAVSETKAAQLLADFPGEWLNLGAGASIGAERDAPNVLRCKH